MLTVATYNMLHGLDLGRDGALGLDEVATAIDALGVSLAAVQEADRGLERTGGANQLAGLAERLGWSGVFAPALLGDPGSSWAPAGAEDPGGPAYGIGLLSRAPIREWSRHRLPGGARAAKRRPGGTSATSRRPATPPPPGSAPPPRPGSAPPPPRPGSAPPPPPGSAPPRPGSAPPRPGWDREPRVALACVVELGGRRLRVVTTHLSYLPWRGLRQLRAAARCAGDGPALLLGDLNLTPRAVRLALPGWERPEGPPTYPAWRPRLQIDHILGRGLAVGAVRAGARATSDHLPLVAEIEWPDPSGR